MVRAAVLAAVVSAAGYGAVLLWESTAPAWLLPTMVLVSLDALVLVALRVERLGLAAAALALLLVAARAPVSLVLRGYGAFDTPFETAAAAQGVHQLFVATPALVARTLPSLERARAGAPDLLTVQSSAVASEFSHPTGREVLPIGGFTGTQPLPTPDELRSDIAHGAFHLVLAFPGNDPRLVWIATHCRHLNGSVAPLHDCYCVPADVVGRWGTR